MPTADVARSINLFKSFFQRKSFTVFSNHNQTMGIDSKAEKSAFGACMSDASRTAVPGVGKDMIPFFNGKLREILPTTLAFIQSDLKKITFQR